MKKRSILIFAALLLCLSAVVYGQTKNNKDEDLGLENTVDINEVLMLNTKYPSECIKNQTTGDVILSVSTNEQGIFDAPTLVLSPNEILSASSINSWNKLIGKWGSIADSIIKPNNTYHVVYRFRLYMNTSPPSYEKQAAKYFDKKKYEKALKYYNKAIEENNYDSEFFAGRSKVKLVLKDEEGAKMDLQQAKLLDEEILTIIDVNAISKTRTTTTRRGIRTQ